MIWLLKFEILNNETLTEENVSRLEVLKQQLQGKLSTLQKIGAEFLTICDLKDIESEIMESDDVETKIIVKTKRIEAKLNEVSDESPTSSAEVPQVNTTTHTPVTQVVAQNFHAKLPNWFFQNIRVKQRNGTRSGILLNRLLMRTRRYRRLKGLTT